MPMRSRKWIWVTLLLTLILGMSLGVMLNELVLGGERGERSDRSGRSQETDRKARSQRFQAWLEKELELDSNQVASLETLLNNYNEKSRKIWSQGQDAYHDLRMKFRQEVRAFLNPEQQKRFDEMMAKHDERRQDNHSKKRR